MPWECKTCSAEVPLDELECPTCGKQKTAWSLVADRTRTLVLGTRRKLEVRRGEAFPTLPAAHLEHVGLAWPASERVGVLTKAAAAVLQEQGQLPEPRDLFCVRMSPRKRLERWTLQLNVQFETKSVEELVFEFERMPEQLQDRQFFEALFLAVHGPEAHADLTFPNIHVIDVSEGTPLGYAPELEVTGFRAQPGRVLLGPEPRPTLDCRRGEQVPTEADAVPFHTGVSWHASDTATVVAKEDARARRADGRLPDPEDLLSVRITPGASPSWRLTLTPEVSAGPSSPITLEFPTTPSLLNEQGYFAIHVLCVAGEGSTNDIAFPHIVVLDVSDPTALGHAPTLALAWSGDAEPVTVQLGSGAPTARWEGRARSDGPPALMRFVAPGLPAGELVRFDVHQVGFGSIAVVEATSVPGGAEASFGRWFAPEAVPNPALELGLDQAYPQVEFTFSASAGERAAESATLPFEDFVHAAVAFADETPAASAELILESPWGVKRAQADADGVLRVAPLPPGGLRRVRFGADALPVEV